MVPTKFLDLSSHSLFRKTGGWSFIVRQKDHSVQERDFPSLTSPKDEARARMYGSAREAWVLCKAGIISRQCESEWVPREKGWVLGPLHGLLPGKPAEEKLCKNRWLCSCFFP